SSTPSLRPALTAALRSETRSLASSRRIRVRAVLPETDSEAAIWAVDRPSARHRSTATSRTLNVDVEEATCEAVMRTSQEVAGPRAPSLGGRGPVGAALSAGDRSARRAGRRAPPGR